MDTPEEADKAISEMSGFELKGRAMTVNQATERPPRDRGGRDGGFRSGGGYQRRDNNRGHQGTGVVVTEVSDPVEDTRGGTTTGVTSRGEVIEMVVTEAGEVTETVVTREAATAATKEVATVVTITAEVTDMVMTTGARDKNVIPKVATGDATTTRRSQPLSQSDAAISPPSQ